MSRFLKPQPPIHVGHAFGVFRLVPLPDSAWQAPQSTPTSKINRTFDMANWPLSVKGKENFRRGHSRRRSAWLHRQRFRLLVQGGGSCRCLFLGCDNEYYLSCLSRGAKLHPPPINDTARHDLCHVNQRCSVYLLHFRCPTDIALRISAL